MTAARTDSSQDSQTVSAVVVAAAQAAAALVPATATLVPGTPVSDPDRVPLPPDAASAITAGLSGEVSGDVVLVVSADVVDALKNSPVGQLDVAAALRPALEAAAATLGRVRIASERVEEPIAALDGLRDKGMFVAVPLLADGEHQATFALQVTLPNTRSQRGSLDLLRHVAMEVTVEIGRTRMTVHELLSLHPGEVVELDRAASAPADLLVNGTLIARGEVVVVDEDFGLRISEIVTDAAAELGGRCLMTWMIIRLVLSLAFVAAVLLFAARLAKKRGLGQGNGLIEVVARHRMGRSSTLNVVRIADLVLVVGATEEQVTLLAEVDSDAVDRALRERRVPVQVGALHAAGTDVQVPALAARSASSGALAGSVFDRNGWGTFVHQLRERTVRKS